MLGKMLRGQYDWQANYDRPPRESSVIFFIPAKKEKESNLWYTLETYRVPPEHFLILNLSYLFVINEFG